MGRCLLLVTIVCAAFAGAQGSNRKLNLASSTPVAPVPGPSPQYAPAPSSTVNGAFAYNCPSPGSTGYLFQTTPCNFGQFAGLLAYCDQSIEGIGYVAIRSLSSGNCSATTDCGMGSFCTVQTMNNGTCEPVADMNCFAGALAPTPGPMAAPAQAPASMALPSNASAATAPSPSASAPAAGSGDGLQSSGDSGASAAVPSTG